VVVLVVVLMLLVARAGYIDVAGIGGWATSHTPPMVHAAAAAAVMGGVVVVVIEVASPAMMAG
jgi:hypothetical protein